MISPKLTNCKECANIPDLLRKIDCKLAELGNNLYNNVVFMLNKPIANSEISQLLVYKRVLQHRFCDTHYAESCPTVSTEDIASKVIRLTAGCVPFCNEPTVCEITTCALTPCPNPTTTTTSTSSTTTTSTSSTTTTTTTLNCNFSGSIDCDVTTTTTTTAPPTTTTTTTYFPDPFGVPCLWSTNGGNPGLVGVYDFDTNTQTDVLVPNDFNETQGINRPMAANETHLYLTSVVLNDAPDGTSENQIEQYDYVLLREWSIDATGVAPVLSYVREIKIETGQSNKKGIWGTRVQAIAIAESPAVGPSEYPGTSYWPEVPFTMLIVAMGYQNPNSAGVYSFDLNAGTLTPKDNALGMNSVNFGNTYSSLIDVTGLLVTTDNNVLVSARYYGLEYDLNAFNYVRQYKGLPPTNRDDIGGNGSYIPGATQQDWANADNDNPFPILNLQGLGVPQFSESWADTKAMPLWGVNGLLQTLQPETNEVYTIQQNPYYDATLTTTIEDDSVWLVSAIPCADVRIVTPDELNDCTPTALPTLVTEDEDGNKVYIGPVSFEYSGMTVEASSIVFEGMRDTVTGPTYTTDCGITIPADSVIFNGNISLDPGSSSFPAFDYTLTFPIPINNIPLRGSIFDTGDNFFFSTNATSTTISEDGGCFYNIQNGNEVYTDVGTSSGRGSGTFTITGSEDFTVLTIKGTNRGNGGGWALGCVQTPDPTCTRVFAGREITKCSNAENAGLCSPENLFGNLNRIYVHNIYTDTLNQVLLPGNSYFQNVNFGYSDNYMIGQINMNQRNVPDVPQQLVRYNYTGVDSNEVPQNVVWDGVLYNLKIQDLPGLNVWSPGSMLNSIFGITAISDDTLVMQYFRCDDINGCAYSEYENIQVFEATFPSDGTTDMIVDLKFQIPNPPYSNFGGELVVLLNEDGTPSKLIGYDNGEDGSTVGPTRRLSQFDYQTGQFEGSVPYPAGWASSPDLMAVDGYIYVTLEDENAQAFSDKLWRIDFATATWEQVTDDFAYQAAGADSLPSCRVSQGFTFGTTTTTTTIPGETTTTTTTVVSGARTIFTKFNLFNQSV